MARVIIGLVLGLVIGAASVFYFFAAPSGSAKVPGEPILPPDSAAPPDGTAQIVLRQELFNTVLESIFRDMSPPTFPLTASGSPAPAANGGCGSELTVLREGSGVQTAIRFDNNSLSAPLAFSGSYDSIFGCVKFTGWARANFQLRYDAAAQGVFGQLNVEEVNLDGVNPVVGGLVTPLVQVTLNNRVNPIPIVDGRQIGVNLPIAATNANLNASVKDIRAEVKENALYLYVIYDFRGTPSTAPQ